jgi:hypothetical protein
LSIGNIIGISALMHMDNTLKGTNVEFNKNTKQKILKINSGYFWVSYMIYMMHAAPQFVEALCYKQEGHGFDFL